MADKVVRMWFDPEADFLEVWFAPWTTAADIAVHGKTTR
jgi:hypothetical protein